MPYTGFLERLGDRLAYAVRWIVWKVRAQPLLGFLYLFFFAWLFFFNPFKGSDPRYPPIPDAPTSAPPPITTPAPQGPVAAQVRVKRSQGELQVWWSEPVQNPRLVADGQELEANCQPRVCTVKVADKIYQLQAKWNQSYQQFEKNFRL